MLPGVVPSAHQNAYLFECVLMHAWTANLLGYLLIARMAARNPRFQNARKGEIGDRHGSGIKGPSFPETWNPRIPRLAASRI